MFLWINSHKGDRREELLSRLNEELKDMNKTCSTGHMARLINVLQGYTDNQKYILGIDVEKEIKKQIFAHLTKSLKGADDKVIDGIVERTPEYIEYIKNEGDKMREKWVEEFGSQHTEYIDECINKFIS